MTPHAAQQRQGTGQGQAVEVLVNEQPVTLPDHRVTGAEVKEAAIAQGVAIEADFILVLEGPNGKTKVVGDDDVVTVTKKSKFSANAGDDNS